MQETKSPRKRRVLFGSIAAGMLLLAAGSALVLAHGGRGLHAMHGGGMGFDEITDHFQVHVEHVLTEVDATPDQQAQVRAIVGAAAQDIQAIRERHGNAHARLHRILVSPTIDRTSLESLRAEHVAALDEASRRCLTALADAAEVLTPEQRARLGEKMAARMERGAH